MRSVVGHQDSALDGAASGNADVAGREVSKAAVHQLGAPPAGAERQVMLFHQRDPQAAGCGVQRDTCAGDAAADHDHVEHFTVGQRGEFRGAAEGVERRRTGHGLRYPFNEWASSTASSSESRIDATIWADWIADWVISRHIAAS